MLTSNTPRVSKGNGSETFSHAYSARTMASDTSPAALFHREVTDQCFVNISIKGYEKKVGTGFKEEFYAFHVVAM